MLKDLSGMSSDQLPSSGTDSQGRQKRPKEKYFLLQAVKQPEGEEGEEEEVQEEVQEAEAGDYQGLILREESIVAQEEESSRLFQLKKNQMLLLRIPKQTYRKKIEGSAEVALALIQEFLLLEKTRPTQPLPAVPPPKAGPSQVAPSQSQQPNLNNHNLNNHNLNNRNLNNLNSNLNNSLFKVKTWVLMDNRFRKCKHQEVMPNHNSNHHYNNIQPTPGYGQQTRSPTGGSTTSFSTTTIISTTRNPTGSNKDLDNNQHKKQLKMTGFQSHYRRTWMRSFFL